MSSDEDDKTEIDCDICTPAELSQLFDESLCISNEQSILPHGNRENNDDEYILYLDNSR